MEAAASSDAHGDEDEDGDEDGILTVLTLSVCWLWNVSILLDVGLSQVGYHLLHVCHMLPRNSCNTISNVGGGAKLPNQTCFASHSYYNILLCSFYGSSCL